MTIREQILSSETIRMVISLVSEIVEPRFATFDRFDPRRFRYLMSTEVSRIVYGVERLHEHPEMPLDLIAFRLTCDWRTFVNEVINDMLAVLLPMFNSLDEEHIELLFRDDLGDPALGVP